MQRKLLTIAGMLECLAGLAFALAPGIVIPLLVGQESNSVARMVARVAGVALLALGVACWGARTDTDASGAAHAATIRGITLYNAGAGLLLVAFAATGQASGPMPWIGGVLHLGMAAAFVASLRPSAHTLSAKSN